MDNPIIKTVQTSGLSETKVNEIKENIAVFMDKIPEWETLTNTIQVTGPEDTSGMKLAREVRLQIRQNRLDAEKYLDAQRAKVQSAMSSYTLEDKLYLKLKQMLQETCKTYENALQIKEDTAKLYEQERLQKLRLERAAEIKKFDANPDLYNLEVMSEIEYKSLLDTLRIQYEVKVKAEITSQRKQVLVPYVEYGLTINLERELCDYSVDEFTGIVTSLKNQIIEIDNRVNTRMDILSEYQGFVNPFSVDLKFMSDDEFNALISSVKSKKDDFDREQQSIKDEKAKMERYVNMTNLLSALSIPIPADLKEWSDEEFGEFYQECLDNKMIEEREKEEKAKEEALQKKRISDRITQLGLINTVAPVNIEIMSDDEFIEFYQNAKKIYDDNLEAKRKADALEASKRFAEQMAQKSLEDARRKTDTELLSNDKSALLNMVQAANLVLPEMSTELGKIILGHITAEYSTYRINMLNYIKDNIND